MSDGPTTVRINGEVYRMVVLRVEDRDEHGRPWMCSILLEDGVAELSKDPAQNCFIIGFVKATAMIPPGRKS